jgi:hypothetical protein
MQQYQYAVERSLSYCFAAHSTAQLLGLLFIGMIHSFDHPSSAAVVVVDRPSG